MNPTNILTGLVLTGTLMACGGGGDTSATYRQQVDSLITLSQQADGVVATTGAQLPDTGTASYSGIAFVSAETDPTNSDVEFSLIGDATVTADFQTNSITGSANNFRGATVINDPSAPDITRVEDIDFSTIDETDYSGTLDISGSFSGAIARGTSTMSGTLTGANTVIVNSSGDGGFGGADAGLFAFESDSTINVNGADLIGDAGVIASKD